MKYIFLSGFLSITAIILLTSHHIPTNTFDDSDLFIEFENWKHEHGKHYSPTQAVFRYQRFTSNYKLITEHNKRYAAGLEQYDLGLNQFADLDIHQMKALYMNPHINAATTCTGTIDWSNHGVIGPVRNQGQTGSAIPYVVAEVVGGLWALQTGRLIALSVQQLIDCASSQSITQLPYTYIIDNGIATDATYPYTGQKKPCTYNKDTQKAYQIKNCAIITPNKTSALMGAVAMQPVQVAVEADQTSFQFYKSGVLKANCGTNLNHVLVLTGYGNQSGTDYWKLKNSWGTGWGASGYILIARGGDGPGVCGILMDSIVPL